MTTRRTPFESDLNGGQQRERQNVLTEVDAGFVNQLGVIQNGFPMGFI